MEREIKEPTPLLDERGRIATPGYARKMVFKYNPERIRTGPFSLKEWDFYQILLGDYVLQLTIGHVSYAANFSANLFSIKTEEEKRFSRLKPFPLKRMNMPRDPEEPNRIEATGKDYHINFGTEARRRRLTMTAEDPATGRIDIDIVLNADPENEKMVIATPFAGKNRFYLNYKENYFGAEGSIRFGDTLIHAGPEVTAVLDWGRGVWPFSHEWFWGNGAAFTNDGTFGFNIGWGFGDLSNATENMFFRNGKAYKLGTVEAVRDENDYMAPWRFRDQDGSFDFTMTPIFDNFTETKIAFINTRCHQVFGRFEGTAILPDGERINVRNMTAFCEHAVNRW